MISVGFSLVFVLFVSFRVFFAGLLGFRDFLECFLSTVYEYDLCIFFSGAFLIGFRCFRWIFVAFCGTRWCYGVSFV